MRDLARRSLREHLEANVIVRSERSGERSPEYPLELRGSHAVAR
jgi:hypothetical protein